MLANCTWARRFGQRARRRAGRLRTLWHVTLPQIRPVLGDAIFTAYTKFAFVRNPFERFVSCLVYVPRERYGTDLRRRMGEVAVRVARAARQQAGQRGGDVVVGGDANAVGAAEPAGAPSKSSQTLQKAADDGGVPVATTKLTRTITGSMPK